MLKSYVWGGGVGWAPWFWLWGFGLGPGLDNNVSAAHKHEKTMF